MGDVPFIESLAKDYKKRAESSGHWTDYIKAHGLANFCVAKDSTEERCKLVYSIEESWYNGRHPLSYVEHQQLIHQHKSKLKSYRDETRLDYQQLDVEVEKLNKFDIFGEKNLNCAQLFSKQIFAASKESSQRIVKLSERIISSSVDILQRIGLTAPCKFAVIGLGSLAKGEGTPYSDLEYAFIVERDDSRYFEKLAVDSYFRIGNLGETPLKHFDIAELAKGRTPNIQNDIAAGYRIDGLTKKAGNIPTGNGKDGSQSLTLTVGKFIELYKSSARSPFNGIAGDLSDMLASSVVIYTNEGEKSQLYEEFVRARIAFELRQDNKTDVNQKRSDSFNSDIETYTFLPEFVQFQAPTNLVIKVKTDIFRYPTLLANNIKMLMGWNIRYSWDIFSNLHRQGILSNENYRYMNIVLALSVFLRTRTYISRGYQAEFVSLLPASDDFPNAQFNTMQHSILFVLLGNLLVPIKQSIKASIEQDEEAPARASVKETVAYIFKSIKVSKTDYLQQAEVCYFAGQYVLAKMAIEKLLPTLVDESGSCDHFLQLHFLESVSCDQFLKIIGETGRPVKKYVELCSYILYHTRCYDSAISYFQWLINHDCENMGLLLLLTGHCKQTIGDYQAARHLFNKAEQHFSQQGEDSYKSETNHEDAYLSYMNIGCVYDEMGKYKEALEYATKALDMCIAVHGDVKNDHIAMIYDSLGQGQGRLCNYTQSIEHLTKSLEIRLVIHDADPNHPHIANAYNNIGCTYLEVGNYALSLDYFKKSLAINKTIYGATTNHLCIAACYLNIGNVHNSLGHCNSALKYYNKSLDMNQAVHGVATNHPVIASCYRNIGKAYNGISKYDLSLEYYIKALDMLIAIHGAGSSHPDIADSCNKIGLVYSDMGNNILSLEYHTKALDMTKAIYGATTNHIDIVFCYSSIGNTHRVLGNYKPSLEYHRKSLDMSLAIYGANANHPVIADIYISIGCTYTQLGERTLSLEYLTKALDMLKDIHGAEKNHPVIADVYSNISVAYGHLGKKKLEYSFKALNMRKAIYGATTNNTDIATSYSNIGVAFFELGNYTSAIEYHTRALDMRHAVYGEGTNHPDITTSHNNLEVAQRWLGCLCTQALRFYYRSSR